ncbi:acyl-CoA thioesterase [Jatrophihabitans fulvus]
MRPVGPSEPRPGRTSAADYPRRRTVELRNSDVDHPSGLVGPQAIARLFEEARYLLRRAVDHPDAQDAATGFVLARVSFDLLEPLRYPGRVEVGIGIGAIGRSSYEYLSALFQDGRCVALSDATVAVRDRRTGSAHVFTAGFRAALSRSAVVESA